MFFFLNSLQICTDVLRSLRDGDFGKCDAQLDDYIKQCQKKFPYAAAFKPPQPASAMTVVDSNHVCPEQQENCHNNSN